MSILSLALVADIQLGGKHQGKIKCKRFLEYTCDFLILVSIPAIIVRVGAMLLGELL